MHFATLQLLGHCAFGLSATFHLFCPHQRRNGELRFRGPQHQSGRCHTWSMFAAALGNQSCDSVSSRIRVTMLALFEDEARGHIFRLASLWKWSS